MVWTGAPNLRGVRSVYVLHRDIVPTMPSIRPTEVQVDLDAVCRNASLVRQVAGVDVFGVVKADAYGHGAVPVARALAASGHVAGLAVSLVEEGVELRDAGIDAPILVMGPALDGGYEELVARNMTAMVSSPGDLHQLAALGRRRGDPISVHLKVDTGMGRLGIALDALGPLVEQTLAAGGIDIAGLCSHLACADTDDPADMECMTARQVRCFHEAVVVARRAGAVPRTLHLANSSGALCFSAARFDLVRVGIALYGNRPSPRRGVLRQAMRLVSGVAALRDVAAGSSVSYGATWRARGDARLAVLPVGYADGYPRGLSGSAEVLLRGQRCPVVGTISMDISVVDVTALGDAPRVGDEVVLLGAQGDECISTSELAGRAGVIEYEVTCAISKRVPRVYR